MAEVEAGAGVLTVTGTLLSHRAVRDAWAVGQLELTEATSTGRAVGSRLTVVGPRLGLAAPGESLRLTGSMQWTKFGEQLEAAEQESLGIATAAHAHRWLERLDGVGPVLARRIHERFGEGVLELLRAPALEGGLDPLTEVQGIDGVRAQTIRESWASVAAAASPEDVRYLDGLNLTRFEVNQVLGYAKKRGLPPQRLLAEHPYDLVEVKGFGWLRADVVARKAGAAADCPARLDSAIAYLVAELCDSDTMVRLGRLVSEGERLTGCRADLVLDAVSRQQRADALVITQDEAGTRDVHPPELVAAESTTWRLLRQQLGTRAAAASPTTQPPKETAP